MHWLTNFLRKHSAIFILSSAINSILHNLHNKPNLTISPIFLITSSQLAQPPSTLSILHIEHWSCIKPFENEITIIIYTIIVLHRNHCTIVIIMCEWCKYVVLYCSYSQLSSCSSSTKHNTNKEFMEQKLLLWFYDEKRKLRVEQKQTRKTRNESTVTKAGSVHV